MPKSSKKAPAFATRPITEFFVKKSAPGPSQAAQTLSGQSADGAKGLTSSPEKSASAASLSVSSATKSAVSISNASSPVTPCRAFSFADTVQIASPNTSANESQFMVPPILPLPKLDSKSQKSGSLDSRSLLAGSNNVFDSDSDMDFTAPSIYVLRSPPHTTSPATKTIPVPLRATENLTLASQGRTNPKKKQRLSSPELGAELVPTSQSDEREMFINSPRREPTKVKQTSHEWRRDATSTPSFFSNDVFTDSLDAPAPVKPPLPPSPQMLDPKTKAEQIIADIKAKAYAESMKNRPETPVREFKDELSDSDDDMFPDSPMKGKGKVVASALRIPPPNFEQPKRYGLRNRESSPSPSASPSDIASSTKRTRVAPSRVPVTLTTQSTKPKGRTYNPLDELLREKKRDNMLGKGSEAFHAAEAALANQDSILLGMEDEDSDDFTSEAAARKAVGNHKYMGWEFSSPDAYHADDSEGEMDDKDRQRLLGEKHGKAVASLLSRDKAARQKELEIQKPVGMPLWRTNEDADNSMDVDQEPSPKLPTSHPILSLLQGALDRNYTAQAALLIGSGAIALKLADDPAAISFLCNLGWAMPTTKTTVVNSDQRNSVLYHLIVLVTVSARFRRICKEETADILIALLLVANDPSSPPELQCEIVLAINSLCDSIASGGDISADIEAVICTKVLKYISTLEPVNKAYITALFGSGCGRARRIGRWIAHGIVTDKSTVSSKRYSDLPPLLPLIGELTRQRSSPQETPGKFEQHENTDFVNMTFYVQILGVAVTNIVGYVVEERKAPRSRSFTSQDGMASPQLPDPPLVLLRTALESLHSRISDIRATHLDRSRTKATLKELSLRIHYQRQVAQQSFRTLHTYFSKGKKPHAPNQ
ncbi:hypothetical protein H0H92_014445 [Tricholoma furcatifolium]|nr:hypothetical protein H0H92_014445 [Tricholoma furcatifolium]